MGPGGVQFSGEFNRFGVPKRHQHQQSQIHKPNSLGHPFKVLRLVFSICKGGLNKWMMMELVSKNMWENKDNEGEKETQLVLIKDNKGEKETQLVQLFRHIWEYWSCSSRKNQQLQAAEINLPFKAAPNDPLSPGTQAQPCLAHNARSRCSSQLSRSTWCFHGFGDQYSAPCHLTQIEVMVALVDISYIHLPTYKWTPSTLVLVWRIKLLNWSYPDSLPPLHVWFWWIKCSYHSLLNISRLIRFIK